MPIIEQHKILPPTERLRQFFLAIEQWELDGGEPEQIASNLIDYRNRTYKFNSSGYKFISQAIELVLAKD